MDRDRMSNNRDRDKGGYNAAVGRDRDARGGDAALGPNARPRKKARPCAFCGAEALVLDYKNIEMLRRYLTDASQIRPRRQTGTCAKHQRALAICIKRARHIALLPFVANQ